MKQPFTIPLAVLRPLAASTWMHDEYSRTKFAAMLECHADADRRDGCTCRYLANGEAFCNGLTVEEFRAMVKAGAVPPEMHADCDEVNQHFMHSLEQFYAIAQQEWVNHIARIAALHGRAAGRILRKETNDA